MGRNFANPTGTSNSQYAATASTPVNAPPLTIACWFQPQTLNRTQVMVQIGASGAPQNNDFLLVQDITNTVHSNQEANAVSAGNATATTTFSATGIWHHAAAVFPSNASRSCYLDGGSKGTNSTAAGSFSATPDTIYLCFYDSAVDAPPFNGALAEVGVWNVALTDAEIAALATGVPARYVRPASLVWYAPLWGLSGTSNEPDLSGAQRNLNFPAGSPAQANHAPVTLFSRKGHMQLEYSQFTVRNPFVSRPRLEPAYFE